MARFDVLRNPDRRQARAIPFFLDIQADSLHFLETRVVIPLVVESAFGPCIKYLHPVFGFDKKSLVLATPDIVGVERHLLGKKAGSLSEHSFEIISAIDYLLAGF